MSDRSNTCNEWPWKSRQLSKFTKRLRSEVRIFLNKLPTTNIAHGLSEITKFEGFPNSAEDSQLHLTSLSKIVLSFQPFRPRVENKKVTDLWDYSIYLVMFYRLWPAYSSSIKMCHPYLNAFFANQPFICILLCSSSCKIIILVLVIKFSKPQDYEVNSIISVKQSFNTTLISFKTKFEINPLLKRVFHAIVTSSS